MATDTAPITEHGVITLPEQAWERARRRAEIIGPLAQSETVGHEAADVAAQALGRAPAATHPALTSLLRLSWHISTKQRVAKLRWLQDSQKAMSSA